MWICTPFGVIMPALRPAHELEGGDKREFVVRAREKAYLDTFRERYCPQLARSRHCPDHDYPWRAFVTRLHMAEAVARMTLDIDYSKFKPTTESARGLKDRNLARRLHNCYTEMWGTQLHYGDGTSMYDWKKKSSPWHGGKDICKREGHYFAEAGKSCLDCERPRPRKLKGKRGYFQWLKGDEKYERISSSSWKPLDGEAKCTECGGGHWKLGVWVPHSDDCLQDDGCPECWALAGEPHKTDCSQRAAEKEML